MKHCFGYIRVSTPKQGLGVSLQEQRDAIERYAHKFGITISSWFEEKETAAKQGRSVFNEMLKRLRKGQSRGVVVHKLDRSARNLKDWADLGDLIDQGIEVHFANDGLDLQSRGGRLSADIQAVVAADYIRNLREETRKGFQGRLKQGLYPFPAPIGYLNTGRGIPKKPDPAQAPLVKKTFEIYGTGRYSLATLREEMFRRGLRTRRGGKLSRNDLSDMLNNPFYMGIIRLRKTGETYRGKHEPIISKSLFDRAQAILQGKAVRGPGKQDLLFRGMLTCKRCGRTLYGEIQKGHTYWRCHGKHQPPTCVREEEIEQAILSTLEPVQLNDDEQAYAAAYVEKMRERWADGKERELTALKLRLGKVTERLDRLTDAYLDGAIEKELYERRKNTLLQEQRGIEEEQRDMERNPASRADQLAELLELAKSARLSYEMQTPHEKPDFLKTLISNLRVDGKKVLVELKIPFAEVGKHRNDPNVCPIQDRTRTLDQLFRKVTKFFSTPKPPTGLRAAHRVHLT